MERELCRLPVYPVHYQQHICADSLLRGKTGIHRYGSVVTEEKVGVQVEKQAFQIAIDPKQRG